MITIQNQENDNRALTPLINGIIEDAQKLIHQQLSLFQAEMRADLHRGKDAAFYTVLGLTATLLAGFFVLMSLGQFVVWAWPEVPSFAVYGAIGLIMAFAGVPLLVTGMTRADSLTNVAEKSVEALKENVEWTTRP